MKVPKGYTEEQVLEIIENIVKKLSYSFQFGCHDLDDIKQNGRLFAMEALEKEKYDNKRPLDGFLYTHVRNRFINFKRDNYSRIQTPCPSCPFYDPKNLKSTNQCAVFLDKMECEKWAKWFNRNSTKRNLSNTIDIDLIDESNSKYENNPTNNLHTKELIKYININLPVELRSDYLRMVGGQTIAKVKRKRVMDCLTELKEKFECQNTNEED